MNLKASLLLLSVFLSICTSYRHNRRVAPNYRRHNVMESSSESCFCFDNPDSNKLVSQIIDTNNNGLERIVVYIYRDIETRETNIYVPRIEKQYLIPDIPFDVDDNIISITNDTIADVLNSSPNIIIVKPYKIPTEDPLRPDTIDIEIDQTNDDKIKEIEDDTPTINTDNDDNIDNNPNIDVPVHENTDSDIEIPSINPIDTVTDIVNIIDEPHYYDEEFIPDSDDDDDEEYVNNDNEIGIGHDYFNWNHYVNKYPKFYNPSNPTLIHSKKKIHGKPYVTFDDWFGQQMHSFHKLAAHGDIKSVDVNTLKMLVMQTLKDNYMYVRKDGVLTNSEGDVLNMSNLILRLVLIGDPITYEKFLEKADRGHLFSKVLPFLETVLVSLVYPPKILGVIPLGKTYVPTSSRSSKRWSSLIPESVIGSSNSNVQIITTGGGGMVPGLYNFQQMLSKFKSSTKTSANSKVDTAKYNIIENKRDDKKIVKPIIDESGSNIKRKFLLNTLLNLFLPKSQKESGSNAEKPLKVYNKMVNNNNQAAHSRSGFNKKDVHDKEEFPGFRIIGGNAATSSGTPVSNRGRSGIIY